MIWINCSASLTTMGLVQALQERARVHLGSQPPVNGTPSCIIFCASDQENLSGRIEQHRQLSSAPFIPILAFGPLLDLPLAHDALLAGASGFIHAGMTADQLVRAVAVATKGELVAPRELLGYLLTREEPNLAALSYRQREILTHVAEGLSNAEIGSRLYLSESTIKQHLRSTYKILGVKNRTEAANLLRPAIPTATDAIAYTARAHAPKSTAPTTHMTDNTIHTGNPRNLS
jgi:DNA-binding NarL/FixJ family response regulator